MPNSAYDQQCSESSDKTRNDQLIQIFDRTNNLVLSPCPSSIVSPKTEQPCPNKSQEKSCELQSSPGTSSSLNSTSKESSYSENRTCQNGELFVMDYITQAGYHISQAVQHETNSSFELAFASYKAAISCLLNGAKGEVRF